jgi:hypothetical protein
LCCSGQKVSKGSTLRKLVEKLQKLTEKIELQENLEKDELSNDPAVNNISEGKFNTSHGNFN